VRLYMSRQIQVLGLAGALACTLAACNSGSSSNSSSGGNSAPGLTSNSVTVATVATISGPVPGLFSGAVTGVKAYADYINSMGGINGRKLVVKVEDDAFSCAQEASQVTQALPSVFSFVGSFTLNDGCGVRALTGKSTPWLAYGFDSTLRKLPTYFSPAPNNPTGFTTGAFVWLKKHYGLTTVGQLYSATGAAATQAAELKAIEAAGIRKGYSRGVGATETDFSADVQRMKTAGVDYVVADLPPSDAKILLTEIQQANYHPKLIQDAALYGGDSLQQLGNPQLANGVVGPVGFGLFLGQNTGPGITLMNKWVKQVPGAGAADLYTVYGWSSAEMFADALKAAGQNPTQQTFVTALKGIHHFDTGGLLPVSDVGNQTPAHCWTIFQVKSGAFAALHPPNGFDCSGTYLPLVGS
jgi:ABC-type branched-subunit amino acid transport system substrate-binding protein